MQNQSAQESRLSASSRLCGLITSSRPCGLVTSSRPCGLEESCSNEFDIESGNEEQEYYQDCYTIPESQLYNDDYQYIFDEDEENDSSEQELYRPLFDNFVNLDLNLDSDEHSDDTIIAIYNEVDENEYQDTYVDTYIDTENDTVFIV
jgi:hypothetical protein